MGDAFETALLRLVGQIGPGDSVGPADVAREVAQETGVEWEQLLRAVRRAAVKLALDGRVILLLKGEAVDPENFRGVYRIGGADYFTPRKAEPEHSARPAPFAPAHDYRPAPHPYTPPPAPPPAATADVASRAVVTPVPPLITVPLSAARTEPLVEEILRERNFAEEIESAFETVLSEQAAEPIDAEPEPEAAIDEGTPVTRFEYAAVPTAENEDEPDFPDEAQPEEETDEELPSPLPPLPPSLSFDDEDDENYDEDASRAPRSATLDDIASQLERYLAAELNNPSRRDAEIGDDIVGLPGEQDK